MYCKNFDAPIVLGTEPVRELEESERYDNDFNPLMLPGIVPIRVLEERSI